MIQYRLSILSAIVVSFFIFLILLIHTWVKESYRVPPESCKPTFSFASNIPHFIPSDSWRQNNIVPNSIAYEQSCTSYIYFNSNVSDERVFQFYNNFFVEKGFIASGSGKITYDQTGETSGQYQWWNNDKFDNYLESSYIDSQGAKLKETKYQIVISAKK